MLPFLIGICIGEEEAKRKQAKEERMYRLTHPDPAPEIDNEAYWKHIDELSKEYDEEMKKRKGG